MSTCYSKENSGRGMERSHQRGVSRGKGRRSDERRGRSPERYARLQSADGGRSKNDTVDERRPRADSAGEEVAFSKAKVSEVDTSGIEESP